MPCQNNKKLTKGDTTPANMTLTLIWHHYVCVVISNIICKFDEQILRNGKVSFLVFVMDGPTDRHTDRQTNGRTDGQSDPHYRFLSEWATQKETI